jgi:hypothetical protein
MHRNVEILGEQTLKMIVATPTLVQQGSLDLADSTLHV